MRTRPVHYQGIDCAGRRQTTRRQPQVTDVRDDVTCGRCWRSIDHDDRVAEVAAMRLLTGPGAHSMFGFLTAAQAAERLGVTARTVERCKAEARRQAVTSG